MSTGSSADTVGKPRSLLVAMVVALRLRQWLKNALVFAAPLAAGSIFERSVLLPTLGAFIAFCLISSSTYLINDMRDVESDRQHPKKSRRPIASGDLKPAIAGVMAIVLLSLSLILGWLIRPELAGVLVIYFIFTLSYSLILKHQPVVELALLAMGFLLRAIAGGVASDLPISQWFLIVAGFGSLFMAAGKRFSELDRALKESAGVPPTMRRSLSGYSLSYLRFVSGVAASVTIVSYSLWAFEVGQAPSTLPWAQWSILPFVLAILLYASDIDQAKTEAPEHAITRDKVLLLMGMIWLILFSLGAMGV